MSQKGATMGGVHVRRQRVSERMQPRPVKAKEYCWHTGIERKRDMIIRVIYL